MHIGYDVLCGAMKPLDRNKDRFELHNWSLYVVLLDCCLNETVAQMKGVQQNPSFITAEIKAYIFITCTCVSICCTFLCVPVHCFHWYASKRSMINDQINRPISFCAICTINTWPRESWLCICFVEWLTNQSCLLALKGGDCSQYAVHELSTVNGRLYMAFTITFKSLGSITFFLLI